MTNGVVSIVVGGKVAIKLVTGHDGMKAPDVARDIRKLGRVPTVDEARSIALKHGFGAPDTLIVGTIYDPFGNATLAGDGPEYARYFTTFSDPLANPRWEHQAPYTEVVYFAPANEQPTLLLSEAFKIAVEVHGEQRDKSGEPYLFHVMRVASAMDNDYERAVAILHDVLEDSEPLVAFTIGRKIGALYGADIHEAVLKLTWFRTLEPYMDYIRRLSSNPLAVKVKLADLSDNLRYERLSKLPKEDAERLRAKYCAAMDYLAKNGALMPEDAR